MLLQKIRKAGNSLVVTIPREEIDRLNLHEGDSVALEVRKVSHQIELSPAVRTAFERSWELYKEDYDDLADLAGN